MSILRVWQGKTDTYKADQYEKLLREVHFPSIAARKIPGFQRIDLYRRAIPDGAEFTTLMWFDHMDAVKDYAGPDIERAAISEQARQYLSAPETIVRHFVLSASTGTP